MTEWTLPQEPEQIVSRARNHGIAVEPDSVTINDGGLDYRVAYAADARGENWVLRMPRRPDLADTMHDEANILNLVRDELDIAVPHWDVIAPDLIAYRQLAGRTALVVDGAQVSWTIDPSSITYATELGQLTAALHAIDPAKAKAAGVPTRTIDEVRAATKADLDAVLESFTVAPQLRDHWLAWLDNDASWPSWTVFSHGELHPGHVLVDDDGHITGVLDWTTAEVSDPARDLMMQQITADEQATSAYLRAYEAAGGRLWPGVAEQCAQRGAFAPVGYGTFALQTGDEQHRAVAQSLLDPQQPAE